MLCRGVGKKWEKKRHASESNARFRWRSEFSVNGKEGCAGNMVHSKKDGIVWGIRRGYDT